MRLFSLVVMAGLGAGSAWADMIRFGDTGSIFGGSTWEITPDDRVTFTAYGDDAVFAARSEWVWTNRDLRAGRITFVIRDAFARASGVVQLAGDPGPAPVFAGDCTDAGFRSVSVDLPGLAYEVAVDNCIAGSTAVTGVIKRHYLAVRGIQAAVTAELGLAGLLQN